MYLYYYSVVSMDIRSTAECSTTTLRRKYIHWHILDLGREKSGLTQAYLAPILDFSRRTELDRPTGRTYWGLEARAQIGFSSRGERKLISDCCRTSGSCIFDLEA